MRGKNSFMIISAVWLLISSESCGFLFRKKPINQLVHDPFQVKKEPITPTNLFSWLNLKNHIKFKIWTRENPILAQEIKIGDLESLHSSNFDRRRLTKILVHGWAHSANEIFIEEWIVQLRDAYLRLGDFNVIFVDYTLLALPILYWSAAPDLATTQLCAFLTFLTDNGAQLEHFHMLGFSWGAHVAGNAGFKMDGKIGRITGLDPANPTYRLIEDDKRLSKHDAQYVDIIHTNGGGPFMEGHLGLDMPLGHADFYPNSGNAQPGCAKKWTYFYETLECDHARSVNYFTESITSPWAFHACRCDSWASYVKGTCPCTPEDMTYMGEHSPHTTRGVFYLFTRSTQPYGLGVHSYVSLPNIEEYDADNPFTSQSKYPPKLSNILHQKQNVNSSSISSRNTTVSVGKQPFSSEVLRSSIILSSINHQKFNLTANSSESINFSSLLRALY